MSVDQKYIEETLSRKVSKLPDTTISVVAQAIDEAFILVGRGDLPSVTIPAPGKVRAGVVIYPSDTPLALLEQRVTEFLSLIEWARDRDDKAGVARQRKRRDELAEELSRNTIGYDGLGRTAQMAIDRVVELEEKLRDIEDNEQHLIAEGRI